VIGASAIGACAIAEPPAEPPRPARARLRPGGGAHDSLSIATEARVAPARAGPSSKSGESR
jgi:hypothetical protein